MIDYNKFITDAYMSVVKNALMVAATDPDPNNIHFYITLETTISGVMIPDWIRADYPNVITIVLNQQYENMVVGHDYFSVTLYFKGKPAPLVFPFKSIIEFTDVIHNFRVGFTSSNNDGSAVPSDKAEAPADTANAEVVSLDDFRKKD